MSYEHLLELTGSPALVVLNYLEILRELDAELASTPSVEYRGLLLDLLKASMDIVQKTIAPIDLDKFKETRMQHYRMQIVKEALVGTNICADTLFEITSREVTAGRMEADDQLRIMAIEGIAVPHLNRADLMAETEIYERKHIKKKDWGSFSSLWQKIKKIHEIATRHHPK